MKPVVSASIMCANLLALGEEVSRLKKTGVDWIHIDVMDTHFVPNIVVGCPDLVKSLSTTTTCDLDVHLMIREPKEWLIKAFAEAGSDIIVVHYEACTHPHRVVSQIRNLGKKSGIALNPLTPLSVLKDLLAHIDMVLIMTVNPGYAGQSFIPAILENRKIQRLREMIDNRNYEIDIQVDGGLTLERIKECAEAGANVFVAGTSSIFQKQGGLREDAQEIINQIHSLSVVR